jgi:uncharacterized protein (UPF0332 family)
MSTQPYELLCSARTVAAQITGEADARAVISRSYYAAFHAAKAFHGNLASPGSVGNAIGSHDQLITCLDNPTIPRTSEYWTSKGISKTLRLAFSRRVTADYLLHVNIAEADALLTLGQSEEIFRRCNQIPSAQIQASQ